MKGREKEGKKRHIIIYTRARIRVRGKKRRRINSGKRKKEILKMTWERF